jgi:cupin superfamily acireductone dioxygenase involved in methionine salvage
MTRTAIQYAEWLINRALKKGEPRKLKRALNATLKRLRRQENFGNVTVVRNEIRNVVRSCRKFREHMAKVHPRGTASIVISQNDRV